MASIELKGGDRLLKRLAEIGKQLGSNRTIRAGFLSGSTYPDGTPTAMVAAIQNYGAPAAGIPPRPFFSNMILRNSPAWAVELAALLKRTGNDADKALALMGVNIAGQLKQSIVDTNEPPLAESTIRAKGFAKPLINTSHMINSVDSEVV